MNSFLFIIFINLVIVHLHVQQVHTVKLKRFGHKKRPWRKLAHGKNSSISAQRSALHENIQLLNETVPIIIGTPNCAQGFTFCENFDLYPYEHIRNMLRKNKTNKFSITSKPLPFVPRIAFEESSSCPSRRVVKYPRIGKTKNKTWEFIVNQEDHVQAVYIEICSSTKKSCQEETRFGYIAECKQRYAYQKLRTPQNNNIVTKAFTMPKDCVCAIKRDSSPFTRG